MAGRVSRHSLHRAHAPVDPVHGQSAFLAVIRDSNLHFSHITAKKTDYSIRQPKGIPGF
jgi:hypothetical protein